MSSHSTERTKPDVALEETEIEPWKAFIQSRFDSYASFTARQDGGGVDLADRELGVLEQMVSHGRRQRNRAVGACSLPSEILASIFLLAQVGWSPSCKALDKTEHNAAGKRPKQVKVKRTYSLGWMVLLHTCSFWRQTGLNNPALWTTLHCLAVDPRSIPTFLSRSQSLHLSLIVNGSDQLLGMDGSFISTRGWLSLAVLRRTKSITIFNVPHSRLDEWLKRLDCSMPALQSLDIRGLPPVVSHSPYTRASLPHDIDTPQLRQLRLVDVGFPWTKTFFRSTIESLTLKFDTEEEADQAFISSTPTSQQFSQVISSLTALHELELLSVFPIITSGDPHEYDITSPPSFVRMVLRGENTHLRPCMDLLQHIEFPAHAEMIIELGPSQDDVDLQDETLTLIPRLFGSVDKARPTELWLCMYRIGMQYTDRPQKSILARSPPISGDDWSSFEMTAGGRGLNSNQGVDDEDLPPIASYVAFLPLQNLRTVIFGNVSAFVTDPITLASWFKRAPNVENLAVYHEDVLPLFEALGQIDDTGNFALFPSLNILALHLYSTHRAHWQREDLQESHIATEVAMLEALRLRWANGSPVKMLCSDDMDGFMTEEVWERLREYADVEFFASDRKR